MTRVTQLNTASQFLRNLNLVASRIERDQIRLTTGLNFNRPSDGPLQVNQLLGFRVQISQLAQFQSNVTDGQNQVDFLDSKLQNIVDRIRDSRTLALQGNNDTLATEDRLAIARQVDQNLLEILGLGNTDLNGRFLFGGSRTQTSPFTPFTSTGDDLLSDVLYNGNQQTVARRIGSNTRYGVNFTGDSVFLEQTYTQQGKALPVSAALGFTGPLVINGQEIAINATDSLRDIERRINLTEDLGASARIRGGALEVYSDYAVREFTLEDRVNGDLLTNLGIQVHGAYTTAQTPVDPLGLPLIDSTPAIFTAAGDVQDLTIDGDNDILNLHLGANANEGTAVSHVIRIPHGVYATVADLATAIQTQVDATFGRNKIIVGTVINALELRTFHNGGGIGVADLQVGGVVDGQVDTASDAGTLNLVAGAGPAALTNATIAGIDGTDQFAIDLGALVTPNGTDLPPITLDLAAANTGTPASLVQEINDQIRNDVRLRGAVQARLVEGRIVFETIKAGGAITSDQLALVDVIPGVLTALGDFTARPATSTGAIAPTVPLVVTPTNREFAITLGPSIAKSGYAVGPRTFILPLGTYLTSQDIVAALNTSLIQQPEAAGRVVFETEDLTPTSRIILRTVDSSSQFRAEDLSVGGLLQSDLGFAAQTQQDGAGVAAGEGRTLASRNLFKDLIAIRDDLLNLADKDAIAKELTTSAGVGIGLFDNDDITITFGGRTVTFQHRAGETLGNLVGEFNRILGGRATVEIARDGRLSIHNNEDIALDQFSIRAASPTGVPRTVFNQVLGEISPSIPPRTSLTSGVLLDPRRRERAGNATLGAVDLDLENSLALLSLVGARSNRLLLTTSVLIDSSANLQGQKTTIEGVNVPEVITRLTADQTTLQAALQVGGQILQASLINYLR